MRARLAVLGYGLFYRLPHGMRRRLVRLATQKYIVGAVTLVRDADADVAGPGRLLLLRQPPGRGWTLPAGLLRRGEPPVVGVLRDGRLLLDCRTVADGELDEVAAAVRRARE